MPENFLELISSFHVKALLSPLHQPDQDHLPDEPEEVGYKPHYHFVLAFDGQKPYSTVQAMTSVLNGTNPFKLESINGYIRYLIHLDNPEKPQYSKDDIQIFSGAEDQLASAFELGDFDVARITADINDWILANGVSEFNVLYAEACDRPMWTYVLNKFPCRSVHALLASNRYGR